MRPRSARTCYDESSACFLRRGWQNDGVRSQGRNVWLVPGIVSSNTRINQDRDVSVYLVVLLGLVACLTYLMWQLAHTTPRQMTMMFPPRLASVKIAYLND